MKIILITDSLGAGGAQRQLVGLAIMLQERGYEVSVVTYYDIDFYKNVLDNANIHSEIIPDANNSRKRIWAVRKYLKKEHPDWVIAYQETPSLLACIAKLLGGRFELLVSERNTTQKLSFSDRVRFNLYRVSNYIVPNSYSQGNFIVDHYPRLSHKVNVITNFVDLQKFQFLEKKRHDTPLVIIAASVWAPKNTLNFIRAVSLLKDRGCKVKMDWYGLVEDNTVANKEYHKECFDLIENLKVDDYITLLPKTQNISDKYREADYFCLPSFYEGTPNVICEAMSSGCPIICSDVCDNARYVKDGENGFLFNPNSPEDMADKLQKALEMSDECYQKYCRRSREFAEDLLSKEKFINSYINIIK